MRCFLAAAFILALVLAACVPGDPVLTPTPTPTAPPQPQPTATLAPTTQPPTAMPEPTATPVPITALAPTEPTQKARVVRVVDGDTIRVRFGGVEYRVRYIGIDTPETVHPQRPVEWMAREASEANRELVGGQGVVLEKDVSETDRFGRLLRYVWLRRDDGWLLVNAELVRRGLAQVYTVPPDVKYEALFLELQREAREAGHGLWGEPPNEE